MSIADHLKEEFKQPTNAKLKLVYDVLPEPLKTRLRVGDALKSYETFVDCYWHLMDRAKQIPKLKVAQHDGNELWLILGGYHEPKRKPESLLSLEILVPRKCADYGTLMERVTYLYSRDVLNPKHPSAAYYLRMFGET